VFNWDSKTPGLAVLFSQLAQTGLGGNMSKWQAEAERYFDNIVNKKGPGYLTNGQVDIPFCEHEALILWVSRWTVVV
jgi:hypothetical protein